MYDTKEEFERDFKVFLGKIEKARKIRYSRERELEAEGMPSDVIGTTLEEEGLVTIKYEGNGIAFSSYVNPSSHMVIKPKHALLPKRNRKDYKKMKDLVEDFGYHLDNKETDYVINGLESNLAVVDIKNGTIFVHHDIKYAPLVWGIIEVGRMVRT